MKLITIRNSLLGLGLGLGLALLVPTSTFAEEIPLPGNYKTPLIELSPEDEIDATGWKKYPKRETVTIYTNQYVANSTQYKSSGGKFKVDITGVTSGNSYLVQLMEYDPDGGHDKVGPTQRWDGNETITWDVSGAVDGGNGAELYLLIGYAEKNDTVSIQAYD